MEIIDIQESLDRYGFDLTPVKIKPWGFTVGIQPNSILEFANLFFPELKASLQILSPRFIIVNPKSRLSWQKHERRSEWWKIVKGPIGVMISKTDEQPKKPDILTTGSVIKINPLDRHRLIGLESSSVIAEIWVHSDINNPSDASDIVRLDDDYARQN